MSLFKFTGGTSPPKRLLIQPSATSPFCNSPSRLQEVTLDADATNFSYMGLRSPGAISGGRSVKEIDEQLTNLKKENFNLKLRIYFLEERMGYNFKTDKEDAVKKNIELMVELENIKKDLEDKHELLCQAAKAMDIEEEEKRKEITYRDQQISELETELYELKHQIQKNDANQELDVCIKAFHLNSMGNNNTTDTVKKLKDTIQDLYVQLCKERERADHFETIMELAENAHVRRSLEFAVENRDSQLCNLTSELEETDSKITSFNHQIKLLQKELTTKTEQLQKTLTELQQKDVDVNEHQKEAEELRTLYVTAQQQAEKYERKVDKYKTLLLQSENKNREMLCYIDTLKNKCLNLENRLEAALDEVKNSKTEIITHQKAESNNTDDALFLVRNSLSVYETSKPSPKTPTKVNNSSRTVHSKSPSKGLISATKSESHIFPELSDSKNSTPTEVSSETQLSNEELLELKKNHFKACKMIRAMIEKKNQHIQQIENLQAVVVSKESEITSLQSKIVSLTESKNSLVTGEYRKKSLHELVSEKNISASPNLAANKENSMAGVEMQLAEQYKELASELEKKIEILQATLSEKDSQLEEVKLEMQANANHIIDLEFEVLTLTQGVNDSYNLTHDNEETVEKLKQEKETNEMEIKRLDGELKQRTCHLQELVNKELWEKNRAIDKMHTVLKSKTEEIGKLQKSIYGKDFQLKILKDKINELGIHLNLSSGLNAYDLPSTPNSCGDVKTLTSQEHVLFVSENKHYIHEIEYPQNKIISIPEFNEHVPQQPDYKELKDELEKSEKLRVESQEMCAVLSIRLDEVCCFLKSLLKHKSVLGFLGLEQVTKLEDVINKSLDLSRTLSISLSYNPDQSLLQLSNITNLLNSTCNSTFNNSEVFVRDEDNNAVFSIIPSDVTVTYQNHLQISCTNEQAEVIKVLREQVQNLKREIQLRDVELEKRLITEEEEKPLDNDDEFVDALVELEPGSLQQLNASKDVCQKLVEKSNLNTTSTTLKNFNNENHSESESWSEPDRSVSMARIGLHDECLKRPSNSSLISRRAKLVSGSSVSTESTEENHLHNLSRNSSKRGSLAESRQTIIALHEQVCSLEAKLKGKENQLLAAQVSVYETSNLLEQQQIRFQQVQDENAKLIIQVEQATKALADMEHLKCILERKINDNECEHSKLILQIKETNGQLVEADERRSKAELKISELTALVVVLEEFKRNVESTMDKKNKEMQNVLNEMEVEKSRAVLASQDAEKQLKNTQNDLDAMRYELANMEIREQKLCDNLEKEYKHNLKLTEEQYIINLKNKKQEYEDEARKCREAVLQIKERYENEYVRKAEVEEITGEVNNLRNTLYNCELKINAMEKQEIELKNKTQELHHEHQQKINNLHTELDTATLQYSEAILEKTRLQNETADLEQKVKRFYEKEAELIKQVNELHREYQRTQSSMQAQIIELENKKLSLELMIGKLEATNAEIQSVNAELQNKLIKVQTHKNIDLSVIASTSLPSNLGRIFDFHLNRTLPVSIKGAYLREQSDYSGYTSEDIPNEEYGMANLLRPLNVSHSVHDVEQERIFTTSSPDLGIESDHGRFSSLEGNIPRPLLPSLELTRSMNNLLDPTQDPVCANDQCCKKSVEVTKENTELRKRLSRTRRALEETLNRLTLANKQKKEVEKSICKQIVKTSQVLRKAKANLDSGSETDLIKK